MNAIPRSEDCIRYIQCEMHPAGAVAPNSISAIPWRAVTISRESGAGGHAVGEALAKCLQALEKKDTQPWILFDRNLVEKVLEDHELPAGIAKFMPEDRVSAIDDVLEDICGLHPAASTLVEKTSQTILRLAVLGNVILIGRGANSVTEKMKNVLHVRLIGSEEKRVDYIQHLRNIDRKAAQEFVHKEDRGRRRYVKKYFSRDIDDPLHYHLIINTDLIDYDLAARIIASTMLSSSLGKS